MKTGTGIVQWERPKNLPGEPPPPPPLMPHVVTGGVDDMIFMKELQQEHASNPMKPWDVDFSMSAYKNTKMRRPSMITPIFQ
jgi:hypothetical protein